jgi:ferredoxin/mono/diheme cytochrome c family protein
VSGETEETVPGESRVVPRLERLTYTAEAPVRRLVGSNRLNPLPHAGTISIFLLIVVVLTGIYITLFFSYGFEASYESVERMKDHPIQNLVRTLHRYSSAGLVVTTLVHAWRIFVAGRFRGPRRWRWTTGVVSLLIVWLAGVTGYWLVWDRRAEALNEATIATFGGIQQVTDFYVRDVLGSGAGSGWSVMFVIWLAHLLLTVVIGWFLWRHVRRSKLRIMPPRHWMLAMGGALLLASLVLPADLLDPVDGSRLVESMPIDPFVLFLLPPMLNGWAWIAIGVCTVLLILAMVLPHVLSREVPVVRVIEEECTGCELCVIDCPYEALSMQVRSTASEEDGTQPRRPIAVVDAGACVGCAICLGSCSFGALAMPGEDPLESLDPEGKRIVLACRRHVATSGLDVVALESESDSPVSVVEVTCSGMIHAGTVASLHQAGADGVQVVGCAPGDCAYGLGNVMIAERLDGTRAPHVARRWEGVASEDFVAPTQLRHAIEAPDEHPAADDDDPPRGRRLVAAGVLVVVSVVAIALATLAPFRGDPDEAAVRVLVDHTPGRPLEGQEQPSGEPGDGVVVEVSRNGELIGSETVSDAGTAVGIVDVDFEPGPGDLTVSLVEGGVANDFASAPVAPDAGDRIVVEAVDVPPEPGISEGKAVFADRSLGGCGVCHSTQRGDDGVGPSLYGIGDTAVTRVDGMSAEEYLRESILHPDEYIVEGYRAGQMLPTYNERLTPADVNALISYLLSLRDESGDSREDGE